MNWNFINTILLTIICFLTVAIFLLDISFNMSWKASITDWLSVIIYACTLIAAIWAGRTASKALNENKRIASDNQKLVSAQTEPFVDIKLEIMEESVNWIRLKITNLGLSSAFNIKCSVKDLGDQSEATKKIIDQFFGINFMQNGFNYLSKGDSKYTGFVNLAEGEAQNGFTVQDFLNTKFTVEVKFEDVSKKNYTFEFIVDSSDINGAYRLGKNSEEQLLDEIKKLNTQLVNICTEQQKFNAEYEKQHRDWSEQELQQKLVFVKRNRIIREKLGLPPEKIKKIDRKKSIHEMRRQMK